MSSKLPPETTGRGSPVRVASPAPGCLAGEGTTGGSLHAAFAGGHSGGEAWWI